MSDDIDRTIRKYEEFSFLSKERFYLMRSKPWLDGAHDSKAKKVSSKRKSGHQAK